MLKFASSRKLSMALAAIALIVAFAVLPGGGPRIAEADVTSADPSSLVGSDGSTISIDIVGAADTGALVVAADDGAADDESIDFTACADTGADCGAETTGNPADFAAVDGPYTATAAVTLSCTEPEAISITVSHGGEDFPVETIYCVPSLADEDVQIQKQSDDDNEEYTFDWDADNGDCLVIADDGTVDFDNDGSFELEDNDDASFYCESSVNLTIDERDDNDFVAIDDCDNDDGVDVNGSSADFDISDLDDTAFCTWINDEDFPAPVPTAVTGQATSVSIVLSSAQISCGGSTLVQVIPRSSSGGPAAAGTTIVLASSLGGSFQPASSITSSFPVSLANFLYTAPANASGTTTITARAGNVQTTTALQIVCGVAPTPVSTTAPLAPPSAGDGGLLGSSSNTGYLPAALAIAAAAVVLGLTAATRRFATVTANMAGGSLPNPVASSRQPGGFALLASFLMLVVALLVRRWE